MYPRNKWYDFDISHSSNGALYRFLECNFDVHEEVGKGKRQKVFIERKWKGHEMQMDTDCSRLLRSTVSFVQEDPLLLLTR